MNLIQYNKDYHHPTTEMLESRNFYQNNKNRVENVCQLLADDESKETYMACWKFRQTHNMKDRPYYCDKNQYFVDDIIKLTEKEVFIDCGAYNGDTIRSFEKYVHNKYKSIVAIEPDQENINMLQKMNNITIIPAATWNCETELKFFNGSGSCSHVDESATDYSVIKAIAIDSCDQCKDATYIKMDLEGAEYNSLLGAQNIITINRPKLAICIYHSDEDMIRLIELVNSWNLDYNFYIRHHAQKISETVVYAIPKATEAEENLHNH